MSTVRANASEMLDGRGKGAIVFDTLQDLKDSTVIAVGQRVQTLGYISLGDGGGNDYEIVAAATGTDDGGSHIDLPGSELQAKGLFLNSSVNVKQFGVTGDSVSNDTTNLQNSIDHCSTNGLPLFGNSQDIYFITAGLNASGVVDFDFRGATMDATTLPVAESLNEIIAFNIEGSIGSAVSSSSISIGDTTITLTDTSGMSADDFILVKSEDNYPSGSTASKVGAIHQIKSVDSSTEITIKESSEFDFTTSPTVQVVNMVLSPSVRNLSIKCGGVGKGHNGVRSQYTYRARFDNISVSDAEDCGFRIQNSREVVLEKSKASGSTSSTTIGTTGYGALIGTSAIDTTIRGCSFYQCRHSVAGGGARPVYRALVHNCYAENCGLSTGSYDCHEDCFDWTFESCTDVSGPDGNGGYNIRGDRIRVSNCRSINPKNNGILINKFSADSGGQNFIIISGCEVINAGDNGIRVNSSGLATVSDLAINECVIDGAVNDGIVINESRRISICSSSIRSPGRHAMVINDSTDINIVGGNYESINVNFSNGIQANTCTAMNIDSVNFIGSNSNTSDVAIRTVDAIRLGVVNCSATDFDRFVRSTGTTNFIRVVANDISTIGGIAVDVSAASTTHVAGNI